MANDELQAIGQRRRRAREALQRATEEAKAAATSAAAAELSEVELARRLGVDRMTIRSWLGKKR